MTDTKKVVLVMILSLFMIGFGVSLLFLGVPWKGFCVFLLLSPLLALPALVYCAEHGITKKD